MRPYASRNPKQKGGTLIAEDVADLAEHERRLRLDLYRPAGCFGCGGRLHAHEHRSRLMLGEAEANTEVAIYRCADRGDCGAVWRVLPKFLARHVWRAWRTIERTVADRPSDAERIAPGLVPASGQPIPATTRARWRDRLRMSAALVVAALATAMDVPAFAEVVTRTGYAATRGAVIAVFAEINAPPRAGRVLGELAGVVHRLVPGVRLM